MPNYDVPAALQADADALKIPIRVPRLPDGWQANSGSRKGIEGGRTDPVTGQPVRALSSTVGYLAPSGMYLSLTQNILPPSTVDSTQTVPLNISTAFRTIASPIPVPGY